MAEKKELPIRSSAAEYLTFVASTGESDASFEMRYEDENIWLTQKMMAALYNVTKQTISQHINRIYADGELTPEATVKKYLTVQTEGNRQVSRSQDHYNLQMIIAVGFKVNNQRAVQFRKWAGQIVKDHTIQGWTMDVERLKKGHMFTDEYFDRQLQQIREIRLSERKFYQKVTDLYATAFDYDKNAKTTRLFFQTVQNKMHFAVHRHTAAELIVERADANKEHMGLTTWENAPDGKILKADVTIAKNYLSKEEMNYLERIVSLYLDYAEACVGYGDASYVAEGMKKLNVIRERAGIDPVLTAWAKAKEPLTDYSSVGPDGRLMQIVRQERMIELYMETHNFWDLRRWKLGEKYFGVYPRGLNVEATKDEDFFKDTQMTSHIREFRTPANYLMPIPVDQVSNNPQMVQNPGY